MGDEKPPRGPCVNSVDATSMIKINTPSTPAKHVLATPGLTEQKYESENCKFEFYKGFKQSITCIFECAKFEADEHRFKQLKLFLTKYH